MGHTALEAPDPALPPPHRNHLLALDGLRGVAALAVVVYHRRWWIADDSDFIQHAYLAVDFFFMLSGLVVALAYEQRLIERRLSLRSFALLRVIRLYPMILIGAVLGAAWLCLQALTHHVPGDILRTAAAFPFAALLVPIPPALFPLPFALNEPSWSLFFEVVANLAFAACVPWLRGRALGVVVLLFGIAMIATSLGFDGLNAGWKWGELHAGFVRVGFAFFAGVGLYRLRKTKHWPALALPFPLLSVVLIAALLPSLLPGAANAAYDLAMTMLVFPAIIVLASNDRAAGRWNGVMRVSGELSYPLYITHFPLLALSEALLWRLHLPNAAMLALSVGIAMVAALVFARAFDVPVRKWLNRKFGRRG
ncbi:acyltransferase family protein [Sphingomonas gei]|uniref:acyltransferase family protein n=1 Tax=Sphingomonas gei TaxID=1395960 RepID=UPI0014412E17|nr:acyltransferase [Sphingomonas gei]